MRVVRRERRKRSRHEIFGTESMNPLVVNNNNTNHDNKSCKCRFCSSPSFSQHKRRAGKLAKFALL